MYVYMYMYVRVCVCVCVCVCVYIYIYTDLKVSATGWFCLLFTWVWVNKKWLTSQHLDGLSQNRTNFKIRTLFSIIPMWGIENNGYIELLWYNWSQWCNERLGTHYYQIRGTPWNKHACHGQNNVLILWSLQGYKLPRFQETNRRWLVSRWNFPHQYFQQFTLLVKYAL